MPSAARVEGWRRAQALGWRMLWARTHRPAAGAGARPVRIGAERDRLGDHHRAGADRPAALYRHASACCSTAPAPARCSASRAWSARSAPMLVIPVMTTGSTRLQLRISQRVAARLGAVPHRRQPDRLCPHRRARGIDPLLLNLAQARRRGRGWWRMLLDQYGAADIVVAEVELQAALSGRAGDRHLHRPLRARRPDARPLRAARRRTAPQIPRMLDEGVRRMDGIYTPGARAAACSGPIPTLVIIEPAAPPSSSRRRPRTRVAGRDPAAVPTGAGDQPFNIQVETPDRRHRSSRPRSRSAGSTGSPRRSPPASRSAAPR